MTDKQKIERLRDTLRMVTDHFAEVMAGPLITGAGVEFQNGVNEIPTIARARKLLKELE